MDPRRPTGVPAWPGVVHMVMNPVPPPYGYGPPPGAPPPSMWPAAAPMQYGAPPPSPHHQQHWPPPYAYQHGNGQLQAQYTPPHHHHHPGAYASPRFNQQQQQWGHPSRSPSMPRFVDPMEHKEHKCEPCQRTFAGKAQFTAHVATHTKCGRQGCTFEASGKMLKEHQQSAHMSPAVAAKWKQACVWDENRDEIERWRAERKRSFPTRDNVERKRKQADERTATGAIDVDAVDRRKRLREILAQQRRLGLPVAEIAPHLLRDPVNRPRPYNPRSQQHGHPNKTQPTPQQTATAVEARDRDASAASPMASGVAHAPMQGTAQLTGDMAQRDSQQGPEGAAVPNHAHLDEPDAKRKRNDSNGNADMPAMSVAEPMERPAQLADGTTGPASTTAPRRRKPCYYFAQGRCRKGNNCTFAHDTASNQQNTSSKSVEKGPARNNRPHNPTQRKRDPTLLEKLLAREIRLENSRLLQAFRFLVLNNFFGEDKPLVFPQTLAEAEADARTADLAELRKLVQEAERDGNMIDLSDGEEDVPKQGLSRVPSLFKQPGGARCGVESGNGADQQAHVGVVHCLDGRTSLVD
eukprot:jgi/Chlat1/3746/Chrsp259S03894